MIGMMLGGCEKETSFTPFCTPEKWFPLAIGNYWIYRNYEVYNNGRIDERQTDSLYISSDTLMLGYRFFHLEGTFHLKPMNMYLTYADGQVISSNKYVFFDCPQVIASEKLYPYFGFDFPAILKTTRVDTLLSLGAGEFNPVMLLEAHSMINDTLWTVTYKSWYAKNTGLVRFSAKLHPVFDAENFTDLIRYHTDH